MQQEKDGKKDSAVELLHKSLTCWHLPVVCSSDRTISERLPQDWSSEKSNKSDEMWKGFPVSKVGLGKVGL